MKKVIVVSKTHLDLGFTDYAESIRRKYIDEFIPNAVKIANDLNADGKKRFVWTTGSWILKEALAHGTEFNRQALREALRNGNIAPHAMPFTLHTELLDRDTLDYGLSIVDSIDKLTGRKTIAAKMTDVPGHTAAMLPLLAAHGIKLLHIGVNGASAMPELPECFLWKRGENEVIVIYSGYYGGEFKCSLIDDILYFDHTNDNHGANGAEAVLKSFNKIQKRYPGHQVVAGRMDDYAQLLHSVKDKLPVIESEIGDTWIHGCATDPYKSAALRTLMDLKRKWLADATLERGSCEYTSFSDKLLCVAEHTCGLDVKRHLSDYENYLKKDFIKARKADKVKMRHPLRDFPHNINTLIERRYGDYNPGSYSAMEKSWEEQRGYINAALDALSAEHKLLAQEKLERLRPNSFISINGKKLSPETTLSFGDWSIKINSFGGISKLAYKENAIIANNKRPALEYHSYGKADYDFWRKNYTRDIQSNAAWSVPDFMRPLLKYANKKYRQGRFSYELNGIEYEKTDTCVKIDVRLKIDDYCRKELSAAATAQILYILKKTGLTIELIWLKKSAGRLTESTILRLYPNCGNDDIRYEKIAEEISPMSVVKNGSRKLSAVSSVIFKQADKTFSLRNLHSPLTALGSGDILRFDNRFSNLREDGISFILHNNVWGTNFPLWYEDNAYFKFEIKEKQEL